MEDRRKYTRSEESWFITIETPDGSISGETENVSSGGAFIRCEKPLAPNEIFDMVIILPARGTSLKGRAEVIWSTQHGMGVTFHAEDDSTQPMEIKRFMLIKVKCPKCKASMMVKPTEKVCRVCGNALPRSRKR